MSAIFGFSYRAGSNDLTSNSLRVLDHWNRPYGSEASETRSMDKAGIGCRIEHFSEEFSWGGPLLERDDCIAAVDALLYNRDELLELLTDACDNSISDEELLLDLIRQHGFDILARINGDFAGALYSAKDGCWTLFRDHLGVRPLYYFLDEDLFAFSTDIRGLAALIGEKCRPNEEQIFRQFMGYNALTLCQTDYQNIRCVTPASILSVTGLSSGFQTKERVYWKLGQKKIRMSSEQAYTQELRCLITDSVKRRLDAVPGLVGAELSGGLDSSVISILINRLGREACHYSWSQSPDVLPLRKGADERKVILDICRQERFDCQFHDDTKRFHLNDMLEAGVPSHTDTYKLSFGSRWMHAQGARVVFTGHGGDEGVSHRCPPYELIYNREYIPYLKLYCEISKGRRFRLLRTIKWAVLDALRGRKMFSKNYHDNDSDCSPLLHPEFRERMARQVTQSKLLFHLSPCDYVNNGGTRQRMDNAAYQGAACGVRYLFPYVDHRVMDFAVSIPRHLYLGPGMDRKIFREAFRDLIPSSLYQVHYKDYASKRDLQVTRDQLAGLEKGIRNNALLDREYWKDIFDFDAIDALLPPANADERDKISHFITIQSNLQRCILIQNIRDQAAKWSKHNE